MSSEKGRRPANSTRAPTSVDVAKLAGVSQPTVSRHLNGKSVTSEAAAAIAKAIADLGYRPNNSARSLVTNRTKLIAVILGDLLNGYYGELFTTIQKELARHRLNALIFEGRVNVDQGPGELLADVDVDGVIVATSLLRVDQEKIILSRLLPTVFLNRTGIESADSVGTDNRSGGELAARHLASLGHKCIGMITGPAGADAIVARSKGFISELAKRKIAVSSESIEVAGFDYGRARESALRLLGNVPRPTAIFCHNDQIAIATLNAAQTLGISVPGELSVMGFDDVSFAAWERIALTTIRQPIQEIGTAAVDMLTKRLQNPRRSIKAVMLPCMLVERSSTARPNTTTIKARRKT